jgi:hypothetical protein
VEVDLMMVARVAVDLMRVARVAVDLVRVARVVVDLVTSAHVLVNLNKVRGMEVDLEIVARVAIGKLARLNILLTNLSSSLNSNPTSSHHAVLEQDPHLPNLSLSTTCHNVLK